MKKLLLFLAAVLFFGSNFIVNDLNAQYPEWLWAKNAGNNSYDYAYSVATDEAGNSYLTGTFNTSVTFDASHTYSSQGGSDIFIVKYDAGGTVVWATAVGENNTDWPISIALDGSGNVFIAGFFNSNTLTFGTTTLTNAGGNTYDIFITKYDNAGNFIWAKSAGGTKDDRAYGVATDSDGNAFLTGYFVSESITFGSFPLANTGFSDVYTVKYLPDGTVAWANSASGPGWDYATDIESDDDGNLYVTGYFNGNNIAFGPLVLNKVANHDVYLVKFSPAGIPLWAQQAGVNSDNNSYSVAVDILGNSYIAGSFKGNSIKFGTTTLPNSGHSDIFLAKYSPLGVPLWARASGGSAEDAGQAVSIDKSQNVYLAGYFKSSSISFETTTLTNAKTDAADIFIAEFQPDGTYVWAKSVGGTGDDKAFSIAVDSSYNFFVAGFLGSPTITFGSIALTSNGTTDILIAKSTNIPTAGIVDPEGINISFYPNPTEDFITLTHPRDSYICVFNIQGQVCKTVRAISTETKIYMTGLPSGIYVVKVENGKGVAFGKVMKR